MSFDFITSDIIRALETMAHFMKEEAKFGKVKDLFKVEQPISKTPEVRAQVFPLVPVLLYTDPRSNW